MTDSISLNQSIELLAQKLRLSNTSIVTAESCTGGLIGGALTALSGSSDWYQGGVVAYSNKLKQQFLNVNEETLFEFGAVSEQVAAEMAQGIALALNAEYAISTTGIAGPAGGSLEKPVGTVCFGFYLLGRVHAETIAFSGDRSEIRQQSVDFAIKRLIELL